MGKCPYCTHGMNYIERESGYGFTCPDCGGSGYLPECDICGKDFAHDYCEDCYGECAECGEITPLTELKNDICECCVEAMEEEVRK